MIVNNLTPECVCDLYDPNNNFLFQVKDSAHFDDVRLQIKTQKLKGYYVIWKDKKIEINQKGKIDWPKGFYDYGTDLLFKLI